MGECICSQCVFQYLCTPWEELLNNDTNNQCHSFIDINNFYLDSVEENSVNYIWTESSWNKYRDTLFDYTEENDT